ncbi:MAG TPA: O-antigen ligase family protein [Candidatus Saccharimonadales bacterium]|nr:O-antigen ligase family protein [Candidatus Saccharimonadales bacterium]
MQLRAQRFLAGGIQALVAVMPFHAFLVVWFGTLLGQQALWQAWKEVLILAMLVTLLAVPRRYPELLRIARRPLNLVVLAYMILSLLVSLAGGGVTTAAFWFGVKTNLVFLGLFLLAQTVASARLERCLSRIIIITAIIVSGFGFLQVVALPPDWLANFGYGSDTIEPFRLVDPAVPAIRILSTLGGPNQLGSFLLLPIGLLVWLILRRRQWILIVPLALSLFTLFHSYARAAWIGAAVAVAIVMLVSLPRKLALGLAAVGLLLGIVGGRFALSQIDQRSQLQFYLLHGQVLDGEVRGSDDGRLEALTQGLEEAKQHPLGEGLGSAGPASFRSDKALVTENYYLQLAIEAGLTGLALFIGLSALLARELWRRRHSSDLAVPLLGALAGISLINLVLHGWTDSSTALVFWATAGVAVGSSKLEIRN